MKLSFVIELLLIFLLIAFAASRVIDTGNGRVAKKQKQEDNTSNRYCSCSTDSCNCCRDFALPVIPIRGPGCATLQYLQGDNMALSMKFGDRVLTNTTISGRKPKPVCMSLPGGFSKFCGRVYGISRDPEAFHACLGVEIRALDEVEAALRLSCFRFSPEGLRVEPGKPVPADDDDDDDDEDDYGFGDDDDDDDEEEDEEEAEEEEADEEEDEDDDLEAAGVGDENEISADYAGFSILGDLLGFGDESVEAPPKKKPNKKVPVPTPVAVNSADKVSKPVAVVVHVSPIHNTPVIVETATQAISNNKVMDKFEQNKVQSDATTAVPVRATTAAPAAAPSKAPPKAPPRAPPKAPTRAPTTAPTTAPTVAPTADPTKTQTEIPAKAPTEAPTASPTVAPTAPPTESSESFQPMASTEFTVSVVQDGQPLQYMEEIVETDKDEMVEVTTMQLEEESSQDDVKDESENAAEVVDEVAAAVAEEDLKEEELMEDEVMEDEKAEEEAEEEVDIGVVKEEEPQADEDNMATTEMSPESADMVSTPEAVKNSELSEAIPLAPAVVPTNAPTVEKDEDEEEADEVVEEVEEAVATVIGQGEEEDEDEEDEDDEEDDEEDEEKPDDDKEDDDYDLGIDDEDEDEEEEDEAQTSTTEKAPESTKPVGGERRWRQRRNRLDHILWN